MDLLQISLQIPPSDDRVHVICIKALSLLLEDVYELVVLSIEVLILFGENGVLLGGGFWENGELGQIVAY